MLSNVIFYGLDGFFQNLKLKASTTPNKHWQNVVEGRGYHSHKQHVHFLAWRSERSPLVYIIIENAERKFHENFPAIF